MGLRGVDRGVLGIDLLSGVGYVVACERSSALKGPLQSRERAMSTMDGTDKYSLCDLEQIVIWFFDDNPVKPKWEWCSYVILPNPQSQRVRQIAKAMLRIDYEGLTEEQFEWFFETFHLNYEWEHRYMAFARAAIAAM
jgi:hypothetical protein